MAEIDIIIDANGNERRCGSWINPPGLVMSGQTFESEHPQAAEWDDAKIRSVITSPDRTPRRVLFGPRWILNQRSHGSCNPFATAGCSQRIRYLRGIQDGMLLSGAYLYHKVNGGRDAGSALAATLAAVKDGICEASLCTWDQIYPHQVSPAAHADAKKHRGLVMYPVETLRGLRVAVAMGYCCVVAVHAGRGYQTVNQQGISGVDNGRGNHAVCVDDLCMIGGHEVFDSPGSWGTGLGIDGRVYLTMESFQQTFGSHTFWALAALDDFTEADQ